MQTVKLFIDASFCDHSKQSAWGAYFRCPETKERFNLCGKLNKTKNSTHAEIQAIKEALIKINELNNKNYKFVIFCDCKSITDLFNHQASSICREIRKDFNYIRENYQTHIESVQHIKGHAQRDDVSENAVGNRKAHFLAYNTLRSN